MKQALIVTLALVGFAMTSSVNRVAPTSFGHSKSVLMPSLATSGSSWLVLYDELKLANSGLSRNAYALALRGMHQLKLTKLLLSIVDMSQPSDHKRLYIIDLEAKRLLFNTYVAHGRNSGELLAKRFSNTNSSFQSSLGFYKTLGLYQGKHGLSMQLQGLERGINDNAFARAIVMHGAPYVSESTIRQTGRLGRSQGCPAVSTAECSPIVRTIAGGSCLFIYSPDQHYLKQSVFCRESSAD